MAKLYQYCNNNNCTILCSKFTYPFCFPPPEVFSVVTPKNSLYSNMTYLENFYSGQYVFCYSNTLYQTPVPLVTYFVLPGMSGRFAGGDLARGDCRMERRKARSYTIRVPRNDKHIFKKINCGEMRLKIVWNAFAEESADKWSKKRYFVLCSNGSLRKLPLIS